MPSPLLALAFSLPAPGFALPLFWYLASEYSEKVANRDAMAFRSAVGMTKRVPALPLPDVSKAVVRATTSSRSSGRTMAAPKYRLSSGRHAGVSAASARR